MLIGVNWPTYQNQLADATTEDWRKWVAFAGDSDGSDLCVRINHHAPPWDYARLLGAYPNLTFIVRWYWPLGDARPDNVLDAKKYADWPRTLRQIIQWLLDHRCKFVVELDNEPNLEWPAETTPTQALTWWQVNVMAIKREFPSIKILVFALSPSDTEAAWWRVLRAQGAAADGVALHEYWQGGIYLEAWASWRHLLYSAVPELWFTEIANTGWPASPLRANQYFGAFKWLEGRGVKAACLWTLGSDDPQFALHVLSLEECKTLRELIRYQKEVKVPEFVLGFKAIADKYPSVVGEALENERYDDEGNSEQFTSTGLFIYRNGLNKVYFFRASETS